MSNTGAHWHANLNGIRCTHALNVVFVGLGEYGGLEGVMGFAQDILLVLNGEGGIAFKLCMF